MKQLTLGFVSVVLDDAIDKALDYAIPEEFSERIALGMRVLVPVRNQLRKGTIIALKEQSEIPKVLPIKELLSEDRFLPDDLLQLARWMERYYCASFRRIYKFFLPKSVRSEIKPKVQYHIKRALSNEKLTKLCLELRSKFPAQAKIIEVMLKWPKGILLSELLEISQVSKSPVDTLVQKKVLVANKIEQGRSILEKHEFFLSKPKILNEEQQKTFDSIQPRFDAHLIHGVTGSGKTEIYLRAIEQVRAMGKSVIMLVPEISLTTQTIERLRFRFEEKIGILHHRLSDGERFAMWHAIRRGEMQIIIGARSAIFCPTPNLGLVIVDEEHDQSYKQSDESPCYNARDLAILRAKFNDAPVLLGSATPSLESYKNALSGKYKLHRMTKRPNQAQLPKVTIVDMKQAYQRAGGYTLFSDQLLNKIKEKFSVGEQILLFLNKRGYHSVQMCTACGEAIKCTSCDVTLTYHRSAAYLACHLCGYTLSPPPRKCPSCNCESQLKFKGTGTEQVERALHAIFPEIRSIRMDADTTRHKGSHDKLFKQFRAGKADILIGTQMIAKGLHFPSVTLVGILNADSAINIPDFRASENVFQLITQVAGRAGRGALEGEVIIQTLNPESSLIEAASKEDFPTFYNEEIVAREHFTFPPFSHLAKLTFSGTSQEFTFREATRFHQDLVKSLPQNFTLFPVVPSGHAKVKDKYRFKILIKGENMFVLSDLLKKILRPPKQVRLLIDIDPTSTFF